MAIARGRDPVRGVRNFVSGARGIAGRPCARAERARRLARRVDLALAGQHPPVEGPRREHAGVLRVERAAHDPDVQRRVVLGRRVVEPREQPDQIDGPAVYPVLYTTRKRVRRKLRDRRAEKER